MSDCIYCTYLTIYSGSKLPPFYIGSSSIQCVQQGYHGTVKSKKYKAIWKSELKKNPDVFKTIIISKHKTRKEALEKELFFQQKLNVVKSPLYINQALASKNGFFGCSLKGTTLSKEHRKKISESNKGQKSWNKGKPHSQEHRKKISESMQGKTSWNKGKPHSQEHRKKISESLKQKSFN